MCDLKQLCCERVSSWANDRTGPLGLLKKQPHFKSSQSKIQIGSELNIVREITPLQSKA